MVKHIVMWELLNDAEGRTKAENIKYIKESLLSLKDKIPQIKSIEIGENVNPNGYDLALYSEFASLEDLEIYQKNPAHQAVSQYVGKVRKSRAVADYMV